MPLERPRIDEESRYVPPILSTTDFASQALPRPSHSIATTLPEVIRTTIYPDGSQIVEIIQNAP